MTNTFIVRTIHCQNEWCGGEEIGSGCRYPNENLFYFKDCHKNSKNLNINNVNITVVAIPNFTKQLLVYLYVASNKQDGQYLMTFDMKLRYCYLSLRLLFIFIVKEIL